MPGTIFLRATSLARVEDEVHAAFDGAVLAVAAVAVGVEDQRLGGQGRRRIGRSGAGGEKRGEKGVCESGTRHVVPPIGAMGIQPLSQRLDERGRVGDCHKPFSGGAEPSEPGTPNSIRRP